MFALGATNLDLVLVRDRLELLHVFAQVGQANVHRGSQGGAQVRGARRDVAQVFRVRELGHSLNVSNSSAETIEDGRNVGSLLHGDNSELIFLVDPHDERFVCVVENASARGPVAVQATRLQKAISLSIYRQK